MSRITTVKDKIPQKASWPGFLASGKDSRTKVVLARKLEKQGLGSTPGLASKSHYTGKIWAFGTKLGLFWDHFWTFPGLLSRYFHENAKNVRKGQNNALSRHFPFQNISNGQ